MTLPPLQDFFSRETDFYFHQFLSNFFKYSTSNFPSSHLYNIFAMYFHSNSLLLKFFSSTISDFFCCLTSASSLSLNLATTSFPFPRFSFFSQVSSSIVNSFYHTKYFATFLIFLLFKVFSIFHSSTLFTSTSFTSSIFCSLTYFLYCST